MTMPRPVDPAYARARRRLVWVLVVGLVLAVPGGLYALGSLCNTGGLCFAPTDPLVTAAGFSTAPDGHLLVVLPPTTAQQTREFDAYASRGDDTTSPPPVWQIERTGSETGRWDGQIELGVVPPGFRETVPLTVRPQEVGAVMATNGCYGGAQDVPRVAPPAGRVSLDDATMTLDEFRADDLGYSPCPGGALLSSSGAVAAVAGAAGVALVVTWAVLVGVARRSPSWAHGTWTSPST
ncbi:hypothetical protein ACFT5B_19175 [Luteimicrobium sp. NPDC057192]|uniref:hypothetical protein n=1 Tax=Luteimicrobium sp. NPDC057192 TaxID=3346042 RepID=UPI00363BE041